MIIKKIDKIALNNDNFNLPEKDLCVVLGPGTALGKAGPVATTNITEHFILLVHLLSQFLVFVFFFLQLVGEFIRFWVVVRSCKSIQLVFIIFIDWKTCSVLCVDEVIY